MEDGTVFREVDLLPAKHPVAKVLDTGFLEELAEQGEGLCVDSILGVVDQDIVPAKGESLRPARILGEKVPHPDLPHAGSVRLQ